MIEHRVSLVATSGAPPSCGAWVSHCGAFLIVEQGHLMVTWLGRIDSIGIFWFHFEWIV